MMIAYKRTRKMPYVRLREKTKTAYKGARNMPYLRMRENNDGR